jgi:DNA repair exonuclease SbcCD ATPase subunit
MKIRRIRIRNFRKLTGPLCIDGLGDGLSVIAGDNEEGKSTVLAAIQAVLFERHTLGGEAATAMLPFDCRVRPEIDIDFDLNGAHYTLRKAFCQRPEAELSGPDGRWTGEEVEERLRDMFSFERRSSRDAAETKHHGIWGLFWVMQATAFAPFKVGGSGREAIVGALESEVGQVLGGERGRALLAAVARRHNEHFTGTGRPKGALKQAAERIDELKATLTALTDDMRHYTEKVDELGRLRARLATLEREKALETAEAALAESEAAQKAIDALGGAMKEAEDSERIADIEWKAAQQAWAARQAAIDAVTKAENDVKTLERNAADAVGQRDAAEKEKNGAEDAWTTARNDFGRAEAILNAAERSLTRTRLTLELDESIRRLRAAQTAEQTAQRQRERARAIPVDTAAMTELRRLDKRAAAALLRLEMVATRIEMVPDQGREALLNGDPCPHDGPLLLTDAATFTLDGFGTLTITPGGEDLATRRKDADIAQKALDGGLAGLGVADVLAAERLAAERTALSVEAESQRALVGAHAPEGIEALERDVRLKTEERTELSQGEAEPAVTMEKAEHDREAARRSVAGARRLRDDAEKALQAATARHTSAREAWIEANTEHAEALRQTDQLRRALDDARRTADDNTLRRARDDRADAHEKARAVTAQRRRALDDADPEAVRLRLAQHRDALALLRETIDAQSKRATELEIELRTLGQAGLGERIQVVKGDLETAEASYQRLDRQAAAVKLLLATLTAAERDAKETFLGPVRERIQPYLRLLIPDAELALANEDLGIVGLRRGGVEEPFATLSIGTREQLAVLTRLAFADFLRARGRPAAIILDDALAYADDERFDRMQLVLRKAAEHLQIIILTCREREYHALGAPIIRLSECAADPSPTAGNGALRP